MSSSLDYNDSMIKDPSALKSVHFVGIKGVAMTALAIYCKERGLEVTGSDTAEIFPTSETLEKAHITPLEGFSVDHVRFSSKPDPMAYDGSVPAVIKIVAIMALVVVLP